MEDERETMKREYNNMSEKFRRKISLLDFYHLKLKNKSKERHPGGNDIGSKESRI
jgi:hypothetical protein